MLLPIRPYKKRVKIGDIFVLNLGDFYLFGQVVDTGKPFARFSKPHKVVIFNHKAKAEDEWSVALKSDHLIAPHFINNLGFSRGFMPVIAGCCPQDISEEEVCYLKKFPSKKYVDQQGVPCEKRTFIGMYGLGNYLTLGDLVSNALEVSR